MGPLPIAPLSKYATVSAVLLLTSTVDNVSMKTFKANVVQLIPNTYYAIVQCYTYQYLVLNYEHVCLDHI